MSLAVLARKHRAKRNATKATKGKCFYQAMTNRGSVRRSRVKVKKCAIGCKKGCTDSSITKPCQPFVQNSYRNHLRKIKEGCDCNVVLKCKLDTSASEEIEKVKAQTLHGRNHIEVVEYKLTSGALTGGAISLLFGGITTTVNFNTDSITTMNDFVTAFNNAKKHISTQYKRLERNLHQLKQSLMNGDPFVFGFIVYQNFEGEEIAKTGMMAIPEEGEEILGGHAVMAVGFDDDKKSFIIRNSWGEEWGDKGYFYMPYDFMIGKTNMKEIPFYTSDHWVIEKTQDN